MFEASPRARTLSARLVSIFVGLLVVGSIALPDATLAASHVTSFSFGAGTVLMDGDSGASAWSALDASRMPDSLGGHQADLQLDAFQAYRLNRGDMEGLLSSAPAQKGGGAPATTLDLAIPDPSGTLQHFAIYDSPVMDPALAAKFPDIHTYKGVGIDDPTADIRADLTPLGFHASVRSTKGTWYIDPLYHLDQSVYASYTGAALEDAHGTFVERDADGQQISVDKGYYHASDTVTLSGSTFTPDSPISITISDPEGNFADRNLSAQSDDQGNFTTSFVADPDGNLDMHTITASDGDLSADASYQVVTSDDLSHDPPTGDFLRTYRLALVTDPGYATWFGDINGANPALVEAAKVTLMGRIDQLYEDDMSIHMTLIANDDQLNLDTWAKATAPNGACGAAACFTQANLTSCSTLTRTRYVIGQIIGNSDYDIGHLALGEPGGGVAGLGVVGKGTTKAQGCTGIPTPTGDYYAVDYAAHEMGHEFGANHPFNGTQFNCSTSNRNGGTSVEPGSGSSIMAYAGICLTDDLSRHSDPYFSQKSQQEITTYVTGAPANVNEVQTASLVHFGGGNEVQTVTFGPGFQTALTIQPLSVAIGAANSGPSDFTNVGGISETGNVVTVSTGNVGAATTLTVGDQVSLAGVPVSGYNGGPFIVTSTPSSRGFTFTSPNSGLAVSGGGTFTLLAPGLSESGTTALARTTTATGLSTGNVVVITGAGVGAYNGAVVVTGTPTTKSFTYTPLTPASTAITTTTNASGTLAVFNSTAHGLAIGQTVTVSGNSVAAYNGTWVVTATTTNSFTADIGTSGNLGGAGGTAQGSSANLPNSGAGTATFTPGFKINIGGNDSAEIGGSTQAYTNANITAAMNAISGFAGTATATGAASTGFAVTYTGASAGLDVPNFSLDNLSCNGCFSSVQETTHGGAFDSFTINYNGNDSSVITNNSNYTTGSIANAIAGGNEVQTIAFTNFNALNAGNSYQVQIGGNLSAVLGNGGTAITTASVAAAINAISGFAGTVTVTGASNTAGPVITFTAASANTDVPAVTIVFGACSSAGTPCTYTNTETAKGSTGITGWPVGGTVAVAAFGGSGGLLNTGFQVTFSGTLANTAVNKLTFTNMSGGSSGWFGITDRPGADTRGGTLSPTGNDIPVVNAGLDYTIPYLTPFTLTGSATDNNPLTYSWEQNDAGPTSTSGGTGLVFNAKRNGPLFAMFPFSSQIDDTCSLNYSCNEEQLLTSNPSRTFPDLQQIIDNNTDADTGACPTAPIIPPVPQTLVECYSEYLPTSAYVGQGSNASPPRLNFRLTARDGLGGDSSDDATLTLAVGTGPFLVTSPNTAVSWSSGSSQNVTWNVAGTDSNGINTANVKISLSLDGGHTYPTVLDASTPNDGSDTVTIPNTNSTTARIKVEAIGNIFFDISDANFNITKADTSVALSSSANPSVHGQSVDITATVSSAGGTPTTGTVTFNVDGTDQAPTFTDGSGHAVLTTSSLSTGPHTINATYNGNDGFNSGTNSSPFTQTVNMADTTTAVTADSGGTSVYGQGVTFTATVSATLPGAGTPTGSVQFKVDGTDSGSPVTLGGTAQATSASISDLSVGPHTITAVYGGDTDFNGSSDGTGASQTVSKADTTTAITNGADLGNDTVVGQSYTVKWSVTVNAPGNAPGATAPTGTVTVTGGSGCTADVTAGQCDVTSTEHGSKNLVATYGGDGNFNGSASDNGPHDVNLDDTTTAVTLATGANPSVHGQAVSFKAIVGVVSPGVGTPTGTVQFKIDGTDFGLPVTLSGGQAISASTSSLSTQGHSITAVYSGDSEDNGSTSGSFTQTVDKADTSSSVQSSMNPSVHGQSVSFTATVSATSPGAGTPTGLVQFKIDGVDFGGTVALSAGQATSGTTSSLTTAGHSITVVYGGDSDFNGSDNTGSPLTQTVNTANTSTGIVANTNPSVHGQAVSFTATVTASAPGAGTPTGNVQFKVGNTNLGSPVALVSGMATSPSTTTLATGTSQVKAVYLGSTDFNGSTSSAVTQTVNKASTTTTISDSPDPSKFSHSFKLTATVTAVAPGAGLAKGKVQFYIDGQKFHSPVKLKNGTAKVTVNVAFTKGTHTIKAIYLGNKNFLTSTSPNGSHKIN